jgi:hypothetical protein
MDRVASAFGFGGSNKNDKFGKWETVAQQKEEDNEAQLSDADAGEQKGFLSSVTSVFSSTSTPPPVDNSIISKVLSIFPEFSYLQRIAGFTLCFVSGFVLLSMSLVIAPSILLGKFTSMVGVFRDANFINN